MRGTLLCLPFVLFVLLFGCDGKTKEDLLLEGQQYSAQGNYRGAIVLYKNALEKDPNYIEARFGLAEAYLETAKYDSAEKEFQKLIRLDPSNSDAILRIALIHIKTGKPDQAIAVLEDNFSKEDRNVEVLELLGRAYAVSGDLQTAEETFRKGMRLDPDSLAVRLGLARVLVSRQKIDEARSLLTEVLVLDKKNRSAFHFLAELEVSERNIDQAVAYYENLLSLDPKDSHVLFRVGLLSLFNDDRDKADEMARALITLEPESAEGQRLKGLVSYLDGDYEPASIALLNSVKAKPHPNSYFFLGLCYYALQQYEQALNQFQKTLDLAPSFVKARNLSALTLLSQGRVDDAVTESQRALAAEPSNAFSYYILGSAFIKKGAFDDGMAALEHATRLNPELAGAHLQKGMVRIAQGDSKLGEEELVRALQAAPEIQNTRLLLVSHYLRQENYAAAIKTLKDGMTGKPVDGLLYNVLAGAYFKQDKPDDALASLNNAKEISPDYYTPYYNLASYYSANGSYEKAKQEYLSIVQKDSRQYRALLSLASLSSLNDEKDQVEHYLQRARETGAEEGIQAYALYQVKQGKVDEMLTALDEGLELHPDSIRLLELKGHFLGRAGQKDAAEDAFRRLALVAPDRGASYLVRFYLGHREVKKALDVAQRRIEKSREDAAGYLLLSGVQIAQQDYVSALNTITRGLDNVKDKYLLQMQLGTLYETQGETEKAEAQYRQITEQLPAYIPALFARAAIYHRNGDMRGAQKLYEQIIDQSPDFVPALNNLAYLLADNFGRSEQALRMAFKAYQLRSFDPSVMDTFGYLLTVNGRSQEALPILEEALKLSPSKATINLHLGLAYLEQSLPEKARPYLEVVLAKGTPEEVERARALMKTN